MPVAPASVKRPSKEGLFCWLKSATDEYKINRTHYSNQAVDVALAMHKISNSDMRKQIAEAILSLINIYFGSTNQKF